MFWQEDKIFYLEYGILSKNIKIDNSCTKQGRNILCENYKIYWEKRKETHKNKLLKKLRQHF